MSYNITKKEYFWRVPIYQFSKVTGKRINFCFNFMFSVMHFLLLQILHFVVWRVTFTQSAIRPCIDSYSVKVSPVKCRTVSVTMALFRSDILNQDFFKRAVSEAERTTSVDILELTIGDGKTGIQVKLNPLYR